MTTQTASKSGATGGTFAELLESKLEVYRRKNNDYAGGLGTYHNFEHAARMIQSMVRPEFDPVDVVFLVMLGIKTGRLIALKQAGKVPNHESVLDSHGDLTTYTGIWEAYEADRPKQARVGTTVEVRCGALRPITKEVCSLPPGHNTLHSWEVA